MKFIKYGLISSLLATSCLFGFSMQNMPVLQAQAEEDQQNLQQTVSFEDNLTIY